MKLFPSKTFKVELASDYHLSIDNLKSNTDLTETLTSDWTERAFRGQVNNDGFKVISSEIGRGALCVLDGRFDGKSGEIEIRIHKAFKILFSILMLIPLIGFVIVLFINGMKSAFQMTFPLIAGIAFVRFVFIELSFRFVAKTGMKKLTTVLPITNLNRI